MAGPPERPRSSLVSVWSGLRCGRCQTSVHYPAVHRFSYYRDQTLELPRAEEIADRVITLPLHPKLTDADVDLVSDALLEPD